MLSSVLHHYPFWSPGWLPPNLPWEDLVFGGIHPKWVSQLVVSTNPFEKMCSSHENHGAPSWRGENAQKSSWNHHRVLLMFENLGWDFSSLHLPLTGGIDPISSETSTQTTKTTRATGNHQRSCSEELIHDICKEIELKNKKLIRKSPIYPQKGRLGEPSKMTTSALDLTCSWTSLKIPTVSASVGGE